MSFLKNYKVTFLIVLVLVLGSIYTIWKKEPSLGLDLKGGTRLTLEATPSADVPTVTPDAMASLHSTIERRINKMGIGETIVQKQGDRRMIVEIPGVKDPEEAKRMLGKVGNLEFRKVVPVEKIVDGKKTVVGDWVNTGVSGKDLSKASVSTDQAGNWSIDFELNAKGTDKFAKVTTELVGQPLGIFFDGEQVSAPTVQTPIVQGRGVITGSFTQEEAQEMVNTLNAGALPVNINFIEETTVGPLLGKASIEQSLMAGLAGLGLVALFMLVFYRLQGVIAVLALLVYILLTYSLSMLIGVTFTLAGIAGFILSVGMAVDANILIFERTKEEIRAGRSLGKAIDVGFDRAFPSIFDSNTTTLITCSLLWFLGTGSVKGFALTLALGVIISMFSAITVTRTFLHIITGTGGITVTPGMFGVKPADIAGGSKNSTKEVARANS